MVVGGVKMVLAGLAVSLGQTKTGGRAQAGQLAVGRGVVPAAGRSVGHGRINGPVAAERRRSDE